MREADAFGKRVTVPLLRLLRREGLYSSQLSGVDQRDEIAGGKTSRKRGRKAKAEDPRVKELEARERPLQRRLARVETMRSKKKPPN